MSVNSLKESFEAIVSPVQVNPFGDAQAQDHVVLFSLSQQQVIILQYIIGLKERKLMLSAWYMWMQSREMYLYLLFLIQTILVF